VVEAFKRMPEKKLVVIYWENDPSKKKIFEIAKWYENISFVTLPGNVWFTDYVWKCIASIYIPIDEDFWMSPVESMAAWKPVLWVNEGWLKETVIDKKTGVLISEWANVDDIVEGVKFLTPERCIEMRDDCEKRAKDFSIEVFWKELSKIVD
jgi:glycosyltransferase involved in cell wall biosynthesis